MDAIEVLDQLAGSGVSGVWGIFGEATSQNAQDSLKILKSLIYNKAPKTFDTHYKDFWMVYAKKLVNVICYKDDSLKMKNFQCDIYQDYLLANNRLSNNLAPKNRTLGKKLVLGAGAVLFVIASYAYTKFALDQDEQKLKHGQKEPETDQQKAIPSA